MKELKRSNDPVYLSWAQSVLQSEGFHVVILDENMSIMEGSINALQKRLMVANEDYDKAATLLKQAEDEIES